MLRAGKVNARVKELEVALDASDLDKKHAQMEARLAFDKVEKIELEVKKLKLMVSHTVCSVWLSVTLKVICYVLNFFSCHSV